jgi:hypothetical protein
MQRVLLSLLSIALMLPTAVSAAEGKGKLLELQVFLGDKAVGTEALRTTKGEESTLYASEAQLKDKVAGEGWKSFRQRAVTVLTPAGDLSGYDRWIDLAGATQQLKLFQFNGQWRIVVSDPVVNGKKPKPRLTELKTKTIQVVLDERLPSLIVVALERIGAAETVDYVRVDDASSGRLKVTQEAVVDGAGNRYQRTRLDSDKLHLQVVKDAGGRVLAVQGIDGWRATAKDAKVPKDLRVDAPAAVPPKASTPSAAE